MNGGDSRIDRDDETSSGRDVDGGILDRPDGLYERALLGAADPVVVAEADGGTVVAVNDAAVDLFGRSRASLLGSHQRELHPPDEDRHEACFGAATDGETIRIETDDPVAVRTADGDDVPVEVGVSTVTVDGTDYRVCVFREAASRLAEVRERERQVAAMDASLTGISILDADEEYVYMNRAHADILGYEPETLLGETWRRIYDDATIDHVEADVFPELAERGVWEGELVGEGPDGEAVPQLVHLTTLPDGGLVCVNRDIADRRRTERRLAAIRERVEALMLAETVDGVVDEVIGATTDVLDRPVAGYWRHDADGDRLVPVATSPATDGLDLSEPVFERGTGLVWDAFEAGEIRYFADLTAEPDVYESSTPLRSEVIVPVGDHGVLFASSTDRDDFSATERELLRILGTHANTALTLIDRTQELRTARDAREAERRQLRDVIDHVPHLLFAKTADGEFVLANEAVADAYGTTVDELEGRTDREFADEEAEVASFRADDRRVIESGESLYRPEETLTDADGDERILRTWKVPFTPADRDEPAVLGVATDITDYKQARVALQRQRKLTGLNRIGRLLLESKTRGEVCQVGAEAAADALDVAVAVYEFDEAAGRLRTSGLAGTATDVDADALSSLGPGDGPLWEAFSRRRTTTLDDLTAHVGDEFATAADRGIAVPLDEFGLLVAEAPGADEADVEFIETAARNVTAALQQTAQAARVERLNERLREKNAELLEEQRLSRSFRTAQRRLREAAAEEDVFEALIDFATTAWDDAWIGRWTASDHVVSPALSASDGGPAAVQGGTDRDTPSVSPTLTAAAEDTVELVSSTRRDASYERWSSRLLHFGYRSVAAVPIGHGGVVRGTLEVLSTAADAFDEEAVEYLVELCRSAGFVLDGLDGSPNRAETIEADFEWTGDGPFFADVPDGLRLSVSDVQFVAGGAVRLVGVSREADESAVRDYLATAPGLAEPTVTPLRDGGTSFVVERVARHDGDVDALRGVLDSCDATMTAVTSERRRTVATLRAERGATRRLREALADATGDVRLVAKRPVDGAGTGTDPVGDLTDRQMQVLSAAYRRGFFDRPRTVTGDELAEQFDISRSTLHQHLRAAERNLMNAVLEGPHGGRGVDPDTD
jgi:PAS domain S-box-containing protein